MSNVVLDASAVLALIDNEPGADVVTSVLSRSVIGTVNLAEVHSKLAERGRDIDEALAMIHGYAHRVLPFTARVAELTGALRPATRHLGLLLGDRACLALGISLGLEIYTTERKWKQVDLPCNIRLIR